MWIAITSLATVALLCLFILIAMYLGTVSAIIVTATICTAIVLGGISVVIAVVTILFGWHHPDDGVHPRELTRG